MGELARGVRLHFSHYVKQLEEHNWRDAQRGLAHSYSRAKVKFNVNRVDNMIIQVLSVLWQFPLKQRLRYGMINQAIYFVMAINHVSNVVWLRVAREVMSQGRQTTRQHNAHADHVLLTAGDFVVGHT